MKDWKSVIATPGRIFVVNLHLYTHSHWSDAPFLQNEGKLTRERGKTMHGISSPEHPSHTETCLHVNIFNN